MTKKQKKLFIRIIVSAVLAIILAVLDLKGWYALLFAVPYLIAGYDVLFGAFRNILHGQVFDEKFLMAVATLGAFGIGEYPEACAVMIFYQTGELFMNIAVGKSRKSISSLMDIRPDTAVAVRDGSEVTLSPEEVEPGETIVIRPGERIPLDGIIIKGETAVNTSALTGESLPSDKVCGDKVISGTVNLTGVIYVRTTGTFGESTVSRILELVEKTAENKSRAENFITRFSRWYTPCVVIGAVLLAVIPPLFFGQDWSGWIKRGLIFLVVSCPCALVVSVPLTFFGGIGGASKKGILVKGANYLEALEKADTYVFDKTGTLTKGAFAVEAVHPGKGSPSVSEAELLDIAAVAESFSTHPLADSIIEAHGGHLDKKRVGEVEEIAGMGIKAVVDGSVYYVGNGRLMDKAGAAWHECHLPGTAIHVSRENDYLGHIIINDKIKPEAAKTIERLRALGAVKTVMLTGDNEKTAISVAGKTGVDEYRAELLPGDKVEQLERIMAERKKLRGDGGKVVFCGDGINDAPVLVRADVGVAMGAMGSDAAIEAADIVLMDDDISKLADAVKISKKTMRIVRENVFIALFVKALILVLGAFGVAGMWGAVFGDVGVLIIAVLNAMRALIAKR